MKQIIFFNRNLICIIIDAKHIYVWTEKAIINLYGF